MQKLDEQLIIQLFKEEWELKLEDAKKELDTLYKTDDDEREKNILSPDLKVKHKKSGLLYTVVSVSLRDVILQTPEGNSFSVSRDELEDEYVLE